MARTALYSSENAAAVTASDTAVLQDVTRALWIGGSGAIKVRMASGDDVTFSGLSGTLLPIQVDMVYSTGTTAGDIVAMF